MHHILDLFSGVGGLSLGAARAGFNVYGAVENDKDAIATHKINFPKTKHLQVDISQISGKKLLSELGSVKNRITGIIGGPPCQGFSTIGYKVNTDPRNRLFVKFFELVRDIQPDFFLAENVPGIMSEDNQELLDKAFGFVSNDYELLPAQELSAQDFGIPTARKRYMFIGYKTDSFYKINLEFKKKKPGVLVKDAFYGLPPRVYSSWRTEKQGWRKIAYPENITDYFRSIKGKIPKDVGDIRAIDLLRKETLVSGFLGTRHEEHVIKRFARVKQGEVDSVSKAKRLEPNGLSPTLRAGTGKDRGAFQAVRPIHPTANRVITPREAARLQGFPDWFQFSPTKWQSFRQIGNSVCPILAEQVLNRIFNSLRN